MPIMLENMTQLELTDEEAEFLVHNGLLILAEEGHYETTVYVWDDLALLGDDAFDFIEASLKGFRKEV